MWISSPIGKRQYAGVKAQEADEEETEKVPGPQKGETWTAKKG
jgi:hypothetical protein